MINRILINVSLGTILASGIAFPSDAALVSPDSATATSTFSSFFDIGNAIDGSGLPTNFTPTDSHANYSTNNYWTTSANPDPGVSATFFFDNSVALDAFYLWNHRYQAGFSDNPYYGVTQFDLIFKDETGNVLFSLLDQSANTGVATAQTYSFGVVSGVRSVDFVIDSYEALDIGYSDTRYTGIAEAAFNTAPVPEPLTLVGVGTAIAFGAGFKRKIAKK